MKVSRRGFLGTAIAAPLAGREVLRQQAALGAQTGFGGYGSPNVGGSFGSVDPWDHYIRFGIPDWKMEEIRQSTKLSLPLDPDIDASRSMSFAAKVTVQNRRNVDRFIHRRTVYRALDSMGQALMKKFNLSWY